MKLVLSGIPKLGHTALFDIPTSVQNRKVLGIVVFMQMANERGNPWGMKALNIVSFLNERKAIYEGLQQVWFGN